MKPLSYFKSSKDLLDKSLRELSKLQKAVFSSDEKEIGDCVFNFFITNYHIKDWLIQSDKIDKSTVEKYINSSEWLSVCRDLCNSGKHFTIDRYKPIAESIQKLESPTFLFTGANGKQVELRNSRTEIHTSNGKVYELLELAYQSFRAWELFFIDKRGTGPQKT